MPTPSTDEHQQFAQTSPATQTGSLLICLPSMPDEARQSVFAVITQTLPQADVLIASPEHGNTGEDIETPGHHRVAYEGPRPQPGWVLAAGDYLAAGTLAARHRSPTRQFTAVVLLGADELSAATLTGLIGSVQRGGDLAVPCLLAGPNDGLVTAAMLYPLTRALFVADVRSPLPFNIALSPRALERLTPIAQRLSANTSGDALLWPVAEAAIAGLTIHQVETTDTNLTPPQDLDFNTIFATVAASLFADIESKATFWQRARSLASSNEPLPTTATVDEVSPELASLVDAFHLAYANLQQIWSLVLPPQTLLALKKLSLTGPQDFRLAPSLWARIVYDFTLAFHLRTINRGHLLGAFTPLYLAWVASHLRAVGDDPQLAARHSEQTAAAFEVERPYLVSRWRWPDRFNP